MVVVDAAAQASAHGSPCWVGGQPWSAALSRRSISSKPSAQSACSLLGGRVCALRGRNGLALFTGLLLSSALGPAGRAGRPAPKAGLNVDCLLAGGSWGVVEGVQRRALSSPEDLHQRARHTTEENLACHHLDVAVAVDCPGPIVVIAALCVGRQSLSRRFCELPAARLRSRLPCLALPCLARSLARLPTRLQ